MKTVVCTVGSLGGLLTQSGEGSLTPTAEVDWKRKIRYSTVYAGLLL